MAALTRRTVLTGTALGAVVAAGPMARAMTPAAGRQSPALYRYTLGDYELTALHDGTWYRPLDEKFVRNVPLPEVKQALADNFLATDKVPVPFTTLLVNTGKKLVLLDTGTGGQMTATAGSMLDNMAAAGVDPKAIDTIVISHFHPDHINGIKTKDGAKVFPNAEILVSAPEWDFWMDDANLGRATDGVSTVFLNARRVFGDIVKEVTRFTPGQEVSPGITSIAAYGHTPGHVAFAVASGSRSMLVLSDTTNHPWLFVRHPEWQPIFDMDGLLAVDTRKRMLDRAAADKMLVQGYHFPFPASGHIAKTVSGYDLIPVMWQSSL